MKEKIEHSSHYGLFRPCYHYVHGRVVLGFYRWNYLFSLIEFRYGDSKKTIHKPEKFFNKCMVLTKMGEWRRYVYLKEGGQRLTYDPRTNKRINGNWISLIGANFLGLTLLEEFELRRIEREIGVFLDF